MNRRGFLGILGAVAAAAAFDPERALWVPGKKLISIPRPSPTICFGDVLSFGGDPTRYLVTAVHYGFEYSRMRRRTIAAFDIRTLPKDDTPDWQGDLRDFRFRLTGARLQDAQVQGRTNLRTVWK